MVHGNYGKLNGNKFFISDVNHFNINNSNGDQKVAGSCVYGDNLDGDYNKSIRLPNEN